MVVPLFFIQTPGSTSEFKPTATRLEQKRRGRLESVALKHEKRRRVTDQAEHNEQSYQQGRDHERVQQTSGVVLRHRLRRRRQPITVTAVVDVTLLGVAGRDVINRHGFILQV